MIKSIRFFLFHGTLGALALCALTACNTQPAPEYQTETEDRFHEKSFSWNNPSATPSLAKTAALRTQFQSAEELDRVAAVLDEELKVPGVSDSLWKPIDYACNELDLGLWNKYGTISIGDSIVLDEISLKASCRYIGEDSGMTSLSKSADDFEGAVVNDRQYPYKMIGESWHDHSPSGIISTGGETSFKKNRKRFGVTGWYDTDASKIGIRIHTFDCGDAPTSRVCVFQSTHSDWYSNDDEVSKRMVTGVLTYHWRTLPSASNDWTSTITNIPGYDLNFKRYAAVVSFHSADHAGLQFRAISSSGFTSATQSYGGPISDDYVTW